MRTLTEGFEATDGVRTRAPLKFTHQTLVHHALASEFAQVCRTPVDGIYVTPSAVDPFKWFGIIFLRRGMYGGGIFRFKVLIPADFPYTTSLPDIIFDNAIFHPLIDLKSNKLDLSRSFPSGWKSDRHDLLRVLVVVQRTFFSYEYNYETCVNPEAAILYKEHKDKFREMAKEVVETTRSQVYDEPSEADDLNCIRFTPWDASVHEPIREQMMTMGGGGQRNGGGGAATAAASRPGLSMASAAEFRRERDLRQRGVVADIVGKHFPRSYSWFDQESMSILNQALSDEVNFELQLQNEANSALSSARMDRERHGIEPLDLSGISGDTPEDSLRANKEVQKTEGKVQRDVVEKRNSDVAVNKLTKLSLSLQQQSEESVI